MHDFDTEFDILRKLFPNAKFTISMSLGSLSHIVSNKQSISLVITHHCYCYTQSPRKEDHYTVKRNAHGHITMYDIIQQLIKDKYDPVCVHRFLENLIEINDHTYEISFGS